MKKRYIEVLLILTLFIFYTSCGVQNSSSTSKSDGFFSSTSSEAYENPLSMVVSPDQLSLSGTKDGYYLSETSTDGSALITYIDYKTQSKVPLCNRPECKHEDDTCFAYTSRGVILFVVGDQLYLYYPEMASGKGGESNRENLARIEVSNLDGTGRRVFYFFDADTQITYGILTDGKFIYYSRHKYALEDDQIKVDYEFVQQDLSNGNIVELMPLSEQKKVVDVKNNYIFFEEFVSKPNGNVEYVVTAAQKKLNSIEEEHEVLRCDYDKSVLLIKSGVAYRYNKEKKTLEKEDLLTGKIVSVAIDYSFNDFFNSNSRLMIDAVYEPYLILKGHKKRELFEFIVHMDTGEVHPNSLYYINYLDEKMFFQIKSEFENYFLIISGSNPINIMVNYTDTPLSMTIEKAQYSIINKEDYFNMQKQKVQIIN